MRLRDDYREINYQVGDFVRILTNLRQQETDNRLRGGLRFRAGIGGDSMIQLQGTLVQIRTILPNGTFTVNLDPHNVYSADMFTESYIEDVTIPDGWGSFEISETPNLSEILYNGMYLFSRNNDESGFMQELYKVMINADNIGSRTLEGHYIRLNDKQQRSSDISLQISDWTANPVTWMRYGRNFRATKNARFHDGRLFVTGDLYIPDNDVLMQRFGVTNKVVETTTKKLKGHLDLPNIFEGYKYPVVYLSYTELNGGYLIQKEYGFKISNKIFVTYDGKTKSSKKVMNILGESKVVNNEKHLKEVMHKWGKATVKSYEKSVELFGHKTRKKAMFESVDILKEGKTKKTVYKITSIKFNYEKEGTFHHVIELNDGTLNLKFLLEDIELILPTINDYIAPKDRNIKPQDECKLVNNKITPVQKNSTVKVIKMFNRHGVHNPKLGMYDKNTVALVIDKNTNKQFECKIKQLKKI